MISLALTLRGAEGAIKKTIVYSVHGLQPHSYALEVSVTCIPGGRVVKLAINEYELVLASKLRT